MLYFSTRDPGRNGKVFCDIVLEGLAPDGGLYIPQSIPQLDEAALKRWSHKTYPELTVALLRLYAPEWEKVSGSSFAQLAHESSKNFRCPEITPLRQLGNIDQDIYIGELFHGPTYAFKDLALQFLGQVFQHLLQRQGRRLTLLGATSGDTGAAAIYGVRGLPNIQLSVLHPHNAISAVQRRQMCGIRERNICNIALKSNFDTCQSMVKELMERSRHDTNIPPLGSINSINWGRILAQITYYFCLYFRLVLRHRKVGDWVRFVVPTGNFGNVLAGYFAKRMGLPIELLIATNHNNILHQFISQNYYQPGSVRPSLAPAMDIVQPSNLERYLWYLLDGDTVLLGSFLRGARNVGLDYRQLGTDFSSCYARDRDILGAIAECLAACGYVLDPHTACAWHACQQLPQNMPSICLATAHPAKFPEVYRTLLPANAQPQALQFSTEDEHYTVLEPDSEKLLQYLQQHVWHS